MESEAGARHIAFNERDQPVELHLGHSVVIVPPRGRVEIAAADLAAPQVRSMRVRGDLSVQRLEPGRSAARPNGPAEQALIEELPEEPEESSRGNGGER